MIETRRSAKYVDTFHKKYPKDLIIVKSKPFKYGFIMNEMVEWTKENFQDNARMDIERSGEVSVCIVWYCVSKLDALAAKMRWM